MKKLEVRGDTCIPGKTDLIFNDRHRDVSDCRGSSFQIGGEPFSVRMFLAIMKDDFPGN